MKNKRVLVTGADGFIGSHIVERLLSEDCRVRALVNYNSFNSWGNLEYIENLGGAEIVMGDVRDYGICEDITKNIDIVLNLAALIAIPYSYSAPQSYIDTNINGALNICRASLKNNVSRVVQFSTSEVYGTAQYVPMDEKHPLSPQSPYSASKIGADSIAMSFYNSFDLPLVIARPFNAYGPRQSARAFIPSIIIQLSSGSKMIKTGNLSTTRDFNYVSDIATGVLLLADCDKAIGETVNIGSNFEISMGDTLKAIQEIMGTNAEVIVDKERLRPDKSEVFRLWCDNSKIKNLTGFMPEHDIKSGLKKTVEWFSKGNVLKNYKANIYNK